MSLKHFKTLFLKEIITQFKFHYIFYLREYSFHEGLLKTGHEEARKMALTIARRYTNGTMFSCPEGAEVCNMFEKVFFKFDGRGIIRFTFMYVCFFLLYIKKLFYVWISIYQAK